MLQQLLGMMLRGTMRATAQGGKMAGHAIGNSIAKGKAEKDVLEHLGPEALEVFQTTFQQTRDVNRAVSAAQSFWERKDAFDNPPSIYGSAKFADTDDLKSEGLYLNNENLGEGLSSPVWLGQHVNANQIDKPFGDQQTYVAWDQVGSMVTVAPSRTGKGTRLIIPNLLFHKGSAVVIDPKGENFELTHRHRAHYGPIYKIAPFEEQTNAFNPLDDVENETDARQLAEMLYEKKASGDGAFFDDMALTFLRALILYVKATYPHEDQNIAMVRDLTKRLSRSEIDELLQAMVECSDPAVVDAAMDIKESEPRTVMNLRQSFASQLQVWDETGMRAVTEGSDFKFEDLKREEATVYIVIPMDKLQAAAPLVRLLVNSALKGLSKELGEAYPPVLLLLDELLAFGRIDPLIDGLTYLAGYGIRPWLILQDLDRARDIYGDRINSVLAQTSVRTFFGVSDMNTAKFLSEELGTKTTAVETPSDSTSASGTSHSTSQSKSISFAPRPLWTPDEVRANLSLEDEGIRFGLHFIRGLQHPVVTSLNTWMASPELKGLVEGRNDDLPHCMLQYRDNVTETFIRLSGDRTLPFKGFQVGDYTVGAMWWDDETKPFVVVVRTDENMGCFSGAWYWQALRFIAAAEQFDDFDTMFSMREAIATKIINADPWVQDINPDGHSSTRPAPINLP